MIYCSQPRALKSTATGGLAREVASKGKTEGQETVRGKRRRSNSNYVRWALLKDVRQKLKNNTEPRLYSGGWGGWGAGWKVCSSDEQRSNYVKEKTRRRGWKRSMGRK